MSKYIVFAQFDRMCVFCWWPDTRLESLRVVKIAAGWIVADELGNHYPVQAYPTRAQAEAWLHGYNTSTSGDA